MTYTYRIEATKCYKEGREGEKGGGREEQDRKAKREKFNH